MTAVPTEDALRGIASHFDAKRRPREGLDAWYPYYAGFSETFARSVLTQAGLRPGASVMDPWNGSGTTTLVASQLGFTSIGYDLNPVATLVANAKLAHPRDAEHVSGLASRIVADTSDNRAPMAAPDPLAKWLRPRVAARYRQLEGHILSALASTSSGNVLRPIDGTLPPLASFLILALMRAARSLACIEKRTNPTWITPGGGPKGTSTQLTRAWLACVDAMASEVGRARQDTSTSSVAEVADARSLPISSESIDFVLTSPPYCTRIDYIVSTSFELAAMGLDPSSPDFARLRTQSMGAPLARRGELQDPPSTWAHEVRTLLAAIRSHPSPDSRSYYYKTYWQYFSDCALALGELHRTMRPSAVAVLVVQSSYYKDIHVDLPSLYMGMAKEAGFDTRALARTDIRHSLTQINSRSQQHRLTTRYQEAVLAFSKPGRTSPSSAHLNAS